MTDVEPVNVPGDGGERIVIASVNIERRNHLDRLDRFIAEIRPDVLCLQEVMASSLDRIQASCGLPGLVFAPMSRHPDEPADDEFGVALLGRRAFTSTTTAAYYGQGNGAALLERNDEFSRIRTSSYRIAGATFPFGGTMMTVATTHFPWTSDGGARDFQLDAADTLIRLLANTAPLVLAGDFNAPRGGPVFGRFADVWRDNIPARETSSLDPELHRVGHLPFMVDGLFSTPTVSARDVRLHTGVSDHRAISATIGLKRGA